MRRGHTLTLSFRDDRSSVFACIGAVSHALRRQIMANKSPAKPPVAGATQPRDAPPSSFRKFYDRGDFPIALEHDTKGNKIAWKVRPSSQLCVILPFLLHFLPKSRTG